MKKVAVLFTIIVVSLLSCSKENNLVPESSQNISETKNFRLSKDGEIKLGKKIDNPFEFEIMKKAYSQLLEKNAEKLKIDNSLIKVNQFYVRFLPKDWNEYDELKRDTTLKLYDYPLNYEILNTGTSYKDKSICENCPQYQYTSVKSDFNFNKKIKYEIIDKMYVPELEKSTNKVNNNFIFKGRTFSEALVHEALLLTKNYSDTTKINSKNGKIAWIPSGSVRVFDTRLNSFIPLKGVQIRVRRLVVIYTTYTDNNGNFATNNGFTYKANYSLFFETPNFDVRSGTLGQAWINGDFQDTPWNLYIGNNSEAAFYANIFRAAHRYFYGDIGGLKRPLFPFKVKYAGINSNKGLGQNNGNWSLFGINSNIKIWRFDNNNIDYISDGIFSTTIHETCHSTHMSLMNAGLIQYTQVSNSIAESWPVAVEWFVTQKEYRERGIFNYSSETYGTRALYPTQYGHQNWGKGQGLDDYSCIFIDLVDNYNQNGVDFSNDVYGSSSVNDNVTGYNLAIIESGFLKHVYGLTSLRSELKANKPLGVTDAQIDTFINSF